MQDPELQTLIQTENSFYLHAIDLIAASNAPSVFVRSNAGWGVAQFRSAEGLIGQRPYAGTRNFDTIESLAAQRGCALYGAEHCNVQPVSGSAANIAVYKAFLKPDDVILSMSMNSGGHLTHGHINHLVSDLYQIEHYEVDRESYLLDYDRILNIAQRVKPRLIVAGYSAYPRSIDFARFAKIGAEVGATVMADISHISGIVAAGLHSSPCLHGIVVTSSVEKTLRGTRGGFILCPANKARLIDRAVFPGVQSSVGLDSIISKARLFFEALTPEFRQYQRSVLHNAQVMASVFSTRGLTVLTGGTDTHMVVLRVTDCGLTGREAERRLEHIGILTNRNLIPFDPLPPFQASGLRLGTSAVTARGYDTRDIEVLAGWIADALLHPTWTTTVCSSYREYVTKLAAQLRPNDLLCDLLPVAA